MRPVHVISTIAILIVAAVFAVYVFVYQPASTVPSNQHTQQVAPQAYLIAPAPQLHVRFA